MTRTPSAPGDGSPLRIRPRRWSVTAVAAVVVCALVSCSPDPGGAPGPEIPASSVRADPTSPAAPGPTSGAAEPTANPDPTGSSDPTGSTVRSSNAPGLDRARAHLGEPRSGLPWLSGVWPGGGVITGSRASAFGDWRGSPVDAATTYPESTSWQSIYDSTWHITTYDGYEGVLSYGLPMLPSEDVGSFASIIRGDHDWVYRKVARDLVASGREHSIVRIGWEPNGDWFPWNVTAEQAGEYRDAYRRIASIIRAEAPAAVIDFDLACGTVLRGQQDRLDSLRLLYPGDDVVDVVGCDTYDWDDTTAYDQDSWLASIKPADAVGIDDVADFARAHGKGFTVPEWGLASRTEGGEGDNPYYVGRMFEFFEANQDVLVLESYFNEPSTSIANSIWDPSQAPESAEAYRRLW